VHVLGLLHASLADDGVLLDTQPIGASPLVSGADGPHGELDMRAWVETIASVDRGFEIALANGLFRIEREEELVVHDAFESADELLETAGDWRDTVIPAGLAERVRSGSPPFTVRQDVRLRVLIRGQWCGATRSGRPMRAPPREAPGSRI
jgi:hypothetical protein